MIPNRLEPVSGSFGRNRHIARSEQISCQRRTCDVRVARAEDATDRLYSELITRGRTAVSDAPPVRNFERAIRLFRPLEYVLIALRGQRVGEHSRGLSTFPSLV